MEELKGAQHLVNEVLNMFSEKLLPRANHSAQISLHELANKVDIAQNFSVSETI